jgi:hypothetical protein
LRRARGRERDPAPRSRFARLALSRKGRGAGSAVMIGLIIGVIVAILLIGLLLKLLKVAIIVALAVGVVMLAQKHFSQKRIR